MKTPEDLFMLLPRALYMSAIKDTMALVAHTHGGTQGERGGSSRPWAEVVLKGLTAVLRTEHLEGCRTPVMAGWIEFNTVHAEPVTSATHQSRHMAVMPGAQCQAKRSTFTDTCQI